MIDTKYGNVTLENRPESMADDEPVIVFRAQDKLIVPLLARYENMYVASQPEGFNADSSEFVKSVREQAARMLAWQNEHTDQTKLPD